MATIEQSCCFTGHRPKFFVFGEDETHLHCLAVKAFLRDRIEHLITSEGVTHFISGGALGVDTWAMEEVAALKEKYPGVTLECALPYAGMPDRFNERDRARHDAAMVHCDRKTIVCPEYHKNCMNQRNEYMVDNAGFLIAVWTGIMTGTGRTVEYARRLKRTVFLLNPQEL